MEQGLAALLIAGLVIWALGRIFAGLRRPPSRPPPPDVADAAQQLGFVSRVAFERRPLLNKGEFQVLLVLEDVVRDLRNGHRVMAQTSLGEFLRPVRQTSRAEDADLAYRSVNSKRVDFVIVDQQGLAILVVEYQGHGHYQGNATLRDAVKREVFSSAGIALIEVPARFEWEAIARKVRRALIDYEKSGSSAGAGALRRSPS
jgi:hypothetical protein